MHLRTRHRCVDHPGVELVEVGFDRRPYPFAIRAGVRLERVGIGLQRVATRSEVVDLRLEPTALGVRDATGRRLGFADERLGARFGFFDQRACARLRFVDRIVGGALREDQRTLQDLGVVAVHRQRAGVGRTSRTGGGELLAQAFDREGRALEELVDLVTVVAAPRFFDLASTEFLGRHVHGRSW